MKLKLRIFALMAMLLCFAFQANAQDQGEITTETGLGNALSYGGEYHLGNDVTTTEAITTSGVTSVIDLNGYTLTIGAGDNKFCDASNITFKNGTISITGLTVGGNAVFCLDEYEETLVTTLTLEHVNLVGEDYSSAYCIFYIGRSSVLNVKGGEWSLENDKSTSGGVFKAEDSAATLNIDGLNLTAHNVRRVVLYAATTIENSTLAISGDADGVDAEMEHGFNRSPLAISNSTITMTDMVGRGITAENGAVTIENSTVTMTNCQEATIDVRGGQTVTIDDASTVELDKEPTIASGTISGDVVLPVYVAQIGDVKYTDLREAMVAAKASDTVIMLDNVDLADTVWEPVAFKGTFDGKDKVIKNLTINKPGVTNTGFITSLNGTFKNVTFTNPTVTGGENTAVVAARAGGSAALAENITINGTIKVETTHSGYARAAAIVGGWGYGNYKNITVDGGDKAASYIKHSGGGDGRYVAGIVGHADDVQSYENCTVKNITISGGWLCGAIAGPGPADGLATGCVVENVDMGADYSGGMFGWYFGSGTIEDATIKNVTFIDGSTRNGAIGGYSNNTDANVSNVIIENVKNNDGAPLLNHVAKVGEVYYTDLQEAIKAAAPAGTVELLADVVVDEWVMFSETLTIGNGDIITTQINGLTINGNGKTVTVKDVESAGNGGRLFYDATNLNINNLTFNFVDNAANLGGIGLTAGTIENVTFNGGGYAIFPGTGAVTIKGCTFKTNATSIYYEEERDNLVVTGNTFENPANVNVILLRGNTTFTDNNVISGRTVNVVSGSPVVTGNDFNDVRFKVYNVATATIEENTINTLAFNDESVVNSTFDSNTLSAEAQAVLDAANFPVPVAKIGEVYYTDLQAALNAAAAGTGNVTVTILEDVNLTGVTWTPVTVSEPHYPVVTVEGNDKTITGLTDMLFAGTWAGNSGLIIKNLTIANSTIVNDKDDAKGNVGVGAFIGFPQASATITLENCHLEDSKVEGGHWTGGLIGMAGGYNGTDGPVFMNLTIKGCSVTGSTITGKGSAGGVIGHGSCAAWTNVVIEETTVSGNTITSTGSSNNKAGAVMGTIGAAGQATTVNGVTNTGGTSVSATVASNNVKSNGTEITTIYGRQGTETGMLYVAGGSYDKYPIEQGVAYAAPIEGYEIVENADGTFGIQEAEVVVAKIGEVEYETLAAAVAAAKDGETVTLLWAEGDPAIAMNGAVFGKNVTITGTATVDWSKGWFYVGRGGAGNATVTFDGANLTSASANENSGLGIHVSGREKDTNNKYDGTLVIKNSTIALDYLINRGAIELGEGAVLTVKNGFGIAGRPASETENGEAATATVTLNNGSKLVVNNHNGMGLGQAATNLEGYGIMNVNEGATFEATQNFLVTANGTMNVAASGAVNVNGTLTVNGTLVSAGNIAATIAAGDAANIEISGGVYTQNVAEWCIDGYAALPDLNGNYVVGEEPTATVNNLGAMTIPGGEYSIYDGKLNETTATDPGMPLSFVMQFLADQDEDDMATSPYADWYGDFVLTFTGLENGSFSAEGCYLAGYYGSVGWVKVPVEGLLTTIEEGVRYPVMLGVGLGQKYDYICTGVKDFRCALYIPETVLEANPNIEVKLELSVVDNSKGQDAAAQALVKGENIYEVGAYEYEAKDFDPGYLSEFTINDADAHNYTQTEDKIIGTLTYNRTLIEGIWNPLYLPFSVSLKNLADNYEVAYYNTMHSYDNDNNGTFETFEMEVLKLTANELNDVMLKANYPYFIRPKNADACALQIVETDATLFAAAEKVITTTSVSHTFQLKSTNKKLEAADLTGCYAISTDGDWALTAGLKPHRLYLTISANDDSPYATAAAKTIRIVARGDEGFEGTTGVDIVETDNAADGTIYDLSGRPVEEPVKGGMYIINGKKVVY